ncbi:MAG: efflux RND transporter periplasmic adaptor subunit [Puniceicoccaceae bacterium]|nr:MAG: efflux RND transporter periplasmic adaptor subunit [Puniceicoccaceae bacterium]
MPTAKPIGFFLKVILPLAVLLLAGFALSTLWRPIAEVAPVTRGVAVNAVPGTVTVEEEYAMELRGDVGGRVIESALDPGQPVREGDLLVQLDTTDLDLEIRALEIELNAFREREQLGSPLRFEKTATEESLENQRLLFERGSVAAQEVRRQERALEQLAQRIALEEINQRQQLESLENRLAVLRRQRSKMSIRSPLDGLVAEVLARPGDLVNAGASLARLISDNRVVVVKVSEENFAGLRVGQSATVRFLGYGGRLFHGEVERVLPIADPETQRYTVYLTLDIDREELVPGLTGEASILVDERPGSLIIPRSALVGRNVFAVRGGRVHLQPVETGFVSLNQVEIREGLAEGDYVVIGELDRFRDGDRIRLRPDA